MENISNRFNEIYFSNGISKSISKGLCKLYAYVRKHACDIVHGYCTYGLQFHIFSTDTGFALLYQYAAVISSVPDPRSYIGSLNGLKPVHYLIENDVVAQSISESATEGTVATSNL